MLLAFRKKSPYVELEKKLGYKFKDCTLLQMALTHRSYRFETKNVQEDNQRLEFLGDAVLGFIVAAHLYDAHAEGREGTLTDLRSSVTSGKALGAIGKNLELGFFVRLGKGEENAGGRGRPSLLADCVEAIIGAAYLDGGVKASEKIVEKLIIPQFSHGRKADWIDNPKGKLQELSQRQCGKSPEYRRVGETGPAHQKTFIIEALVNGKPMGRGVGPNRREAEAEAASLAVIALLSAPDATKAENEPDAPA